MRFTRQFGLGVSVCTVFCLGVSAAESPSNAGNEAVLAQWAQASGQVPPQVVVLEDGTSKLQWTHQSSVDGYARHASGGANLTPSSSGNFGSVQFQSDLRRDTDGETLDWFVVGTSASNDRAVQGQDAQLNNFQVGRSGQNYRLAAGDIPLDNSSLGARGELRGMYVERSIRRTTVTLAAGLQTESWASLDRKALRQNSLRDAYAVKIATPVGESLGVFATAQGYTDQVDSLATENAFVPTQRAQAMTVGVEFAQTQWKLVAEAGHSTWGETDQASHGDRAVVVDASWQGEKATARMGHHDIGQRYSALSFDVVPGIRETYVDGTWSSLQGLALGAGLRQTRNDTLVVAQDPNPNQRALDNLAFNTTASWTVDAVPGLQLQALHASSRGRNVNQSASRNVSNGLNASYPVGSFGTRLGWQKADMENAAAPGMDAKATTWNAGLDWTNLKQEVRSWDWSTSANYSLQQQDFASGTTNTNRAISLSMQASNSRWGTLRASGQFGTLRNTSTGEVVSQSVQIDGTQNFGTLGSFKLYVRSGRASAVGVAASYVEQVLGMQWSLAVK